MENVTLPSSLLNNINITCPTSLLWSQTAIDNRTSRLYACICACVTLSVFWVQIILCSSVRQKSMQWIYAYLITDILLLFRFFFVYIVHTTSKECVPNVIWALFICYFDATVDNYLNVLEVYILLALNICRYTQIAYNRNVYRVHLRLLILAHVAIYLLPLISVIVQFIVGWVQLYQIIGDSCNVRYTNIYVQIFNVITAFALPIILNILVIYASMRHVQLTSRLNQTQHYVSAREKYHRSLVIQFLVFYIVWVTLWSPNIIVYQLASNSSNIIAIARLLNFIEIVLDPIIIAGLDVRFWHAWCKLWEHIKTFTVLNRPKQARIRPLTTNLNVFSLKTPQIQKPGF